MRRMEICCWHTPMMEETPQNRRTPAGELQLIHSMNKLMTPAIIMVWLRCGLSFWPICIKIIGRNVAPANTIMRIRYGRNVPKPPATAPDGVITRLGTRLKNW